MTIPRIGLDLTDKRSAPGAVAAIRRAEARDVPMVWTTVSVGGLDATMYFAAAAVVTERIRFGTAVIPTYPHHPGAVAAQALVIDQLSNGRFRLGIGPSHRPRIEGQYGIPMGKPLDHLREYMTIVRDLLWHGTSRFQGQYYNVDVQTTATAQVPIYLSALRENAFRLAGEIADGAISWMCPADYLLNRAMPAMAEAAGAAGRARPRLVAHVPAVVHTDRDRMLEVARPAVGRYGPLPFYAKMFEAAGFPVAEGGRVSDDLLEHLVVWGSVDRVHERLRGLLDAGLDELLVMLIPADDFDREEEAISRIVAEIGAGA